MSTPESAHRAEARFVAGVRNAFLVAFGLLVGAGVGLVAAVLIGWIPFVC